ncbi:MAG: apolipoprotein N-acyltransferase [Phycisphaeraceae bacterium]
MSRFSVQRQKVAIDSPIAMGGLLGLWAVLTWLSFPGANLWPAAHLSLVPLAMLALRCTSVKRLSIFTYVAGVIWWIIGVAWLRGVTGGGYVAVAFYLGLYPLIFVWGLRLIGRRAHLPMVLAVPLVIVTLEYFRGWAMTGFPWFLLGQSQPVSLIQIADVTGVYGVSFLVAMTSGLIVDLMLNPMIGRGGRLGGTVKWSMGLWFAAMVVALVYGRWRVSQLDGMTGAKLRIAVVQTNEPQSNKNSPTEEQEQLYFSKLLKLNEQAAVTKPGLIVWPETVVPRPINNEMVRVAMGYCQRLTEPVEDEAMRRSLQYWCAVVGYQRQVRQAAIDGGAYLIVGAGAHTDEQVGQQMKRYNSAYCFSPNGSLIDRYDKVHRVPFGEYVPFDKDSWLHKLLLKLTPYDGFDYSLTPGSRYAVFDLTVQRDGKAERWRAAAPICFEDVFPRECRRMVYDASGKRADVLVNLTNDGWYPDSAQASQHEQLARFRCVENRVPMARAVNRGVSGVFDSAGRRIGMVMIAGQRQSISGVATAEVMRDDRVTLFGRFGNVFAVMCGIVTVLLTAMSVLMPKIPGRGG